MISFTTFNGQETMITLCRPLPIVVLRSGTYQVSKRLEELGIPIQISLTTPKMTLSTSLDNFYTLVMSTVAVFTLIQLKKETLDSSLPLSVTIKE